MLDFRRCDAKGHELENALLSLPWAWF